MTDRPREFWMDTDLLDRALDACDLGDAYSVRVRMYPHKDMLSQLTRVIEFSAYDSAITLIREIARMSPNSIGSSKAKRWLEERDL